MVPQSYSNNENYYNSFRIDLMFSAFGRDPLMRAALSYSVERITICTDKPEVKKSPARRGAEEFMLPLGE
jgi:hypothetical protein